MCKPNRNTTTRDDHFIFDGHCYPINTSKGQSEIRTDILYRGIEQLHALLSHHSKIYQVRLESHSDVFNASNERFIYVFHKLLRWLRNKGFKRVGYLWVRERDKSKNYHYHIVLWLDGHKIRHPQAVYERWNELHWRYGYMSKQNRHGMPNVTHYVRPSAMIHRNKPLTWDSPTYAFSYLCKSRSKGYGSIGTRDFSSSSICNKTDVNNGEQ
jgi:hypothetical protein